MTQEIQNIAKDAGILRAYHRSGKIDINRLDSFLAKVQSIAAPKAGKEKSRFDRQLAGIKGKRKTHAY